MTIPRFWPAILLLLTLGILYLALTPAPPTNGLGWDKANHAAAMSVVTLLAWQAYQPRVRPLFFAGLYAVGLGILIELLQGFFTTSRSAEWGDLLADLTGTACALFLLTGRNYLKEHNR